ncbi:hypothetical protein [Falsiroseomonas sp. E2-1-a20]|uniref:hypothetical protein n=1 Tax=Falsiroseomonas sp. E2-1-a20 TaxID=3239300 RepID=UPI003F3D36C2
MLAHHHLTIDHLGAVGCRLSYNPIVDLAPILHRSNRQVALLVAPDRPVVDVGTLREPRRRRPQPLPYASTGMRTETRFLAIANVPTMIRARVMDFEASMWTGLAAPAAPPAPAGER